MAFLLRAGRHAVGPVWPLPAVPAAWHQAEPLIKQPPSAWVPTEPGPRPRSLRRGHQVGFWRRTPPSRGRQESALGLESKSCPSRPPTRGTAACGAPPPPREGLSFPMWQPEVAGARTRGSTGFVGPEPGLGRGVGGWLAGGPCSPQDGKQIRGGGCSGTPGSGYSHRARNEERAPRMPRPRCPDCTYFLATIQPQPRPPRAAQHILQGALPEASSPHCLAQPGGPPDPQPQAPPLRLLFQRHFPRRPCTPSTVAHCPQSDTCAPVALAHLSLLALGVPGAILPLNLPGMHLPQACLPFVPERARNHRGRSGHVGFPE